MVLQEQNRGFENEAFYLEPSETLVDLANHISEIYKVSNLEIPTLEKKQACLFGRRFLIDNFSLHDVNFRRIEDMESFCSREHTIEEIREYLCSPPKVSPFKLPISCHGATELDSKILEIFPLVEDQELQNQIESIFYGIILAKKTTIITPASYIHEIVHSQLNGKGVIQKSYHREVLSIFLSLVYLYENENFEVLEYAIQMHYKNLSSYIASLVEYFSDTNSPLTISDYEDASNYIVSTLKGLNLFRIYQTKPSFHKEIFKSIQNVFNHKITLEEILKFYEVSTKDEISHIMKI